MTHIAPHDEGTSYCTSAPEHIHITPSPAVRAAILAAEAERMRAMPPPLTSRHYLAELTLGDLMTVAGQIIAGVDTDESPSYCDAILDLVSAVAVNLARAESLAEPTRKQIGDELLGRDAT